MIQIRWIGKSVTIVRANSLKTTDRSSLATIPPMSGRPSGAGPAGVDPRPGASIQGDRQRVCAPKSLRTDSR